MLKSVLMVAVTLAMLVACAAVPETPPQASVQELAGTAWRLVRFEGGDGAVLTPDERDKYTFAFNADGSAIARVDCNRGRGTWKSASPGQLELGPMALTRAACLPGSLHDRIVRQLPYIRSYVLRNGHLYLSLLADGGIYEFEPMPAPAQQAASAASAVPPENTHWVLTHLGGQSITVSAEQRAPNLVLQSGNRRVSGFDGCNRFTGGYSLAGQTLTFSKVASTMMACLNNAGLERAFHDVLGKTAGWRIEETMLQLYDAAGAALAQFESRPMP